MYILFNVGRRCDFWCRGIAVTNGGLCQGAGGGACPLIGFTKLGVDRQTDFVSLQDYTTERLCVGPILNWHSGVVDLRPNI